MQNEDYIQGIKLALESMFYVEKEIMKTIFSLALRGECKELGKLFDQNEPIPMDIKYFEDSADVFIQEMFSLLKRTDIVLASLINLNGVEIDDHIKDNNEELNEDNDCYINLPKTYTAVIKELDMGIEHLRFEVLTAALYILMKGDFDSQVFEDQMTLWLDTENRNDEGDQNMEMLFDLAGEFEWTIDKIWDMRANRKMKSGF